MTLYSSHTDMKSTHSMISTSVQTVRFTFCQCVCVCVPVALSSLSLSACVSLYLRLCLSLPDRLSFCLFRWELFLLSLSTFDLMLCDFVVEIQFISAYNRSVRQQQIVTLKSPKAPRRITTARGNDGN